MSKSGLTRIGEISGRVKPSESEDESPPSRKQNGRNETSRTGSTKRADSLDPRLLALVWHTFSERYGYRWTRQRGTTPSPIWGRDLCGLTAEQIEAGLATDGRRGDAWPPGSSDFRVMCAGHPEAFKFKRTRKALPPSDAEIERRRAIAIEHMKAWKKLPR